LNKEKKIESERKEERIGGGRKRGVDVGGGDAGGHEVSLVTAETEKMRAQP